MAKPLTQPLRLKQFNWNQATQHAFDEIKVALTRTPMLALPDFQQSFTIETNAYQHGIGAVLMQQGQPVAYLNKALGEKHKNLSLYEKEFLALIMEVEKWRHYLQR